MKVVVCIEFSKRKDGECHCYCLCDKSKERNSLSVEMSVCGPSTWSDTFNGSCLEGSVLSLNGDQFSMLFPILDDMFYKTLQFHWLPFHICQRSSH